MGSRAYSQWMQPGAALGPVHTLAHAACNCPVFRTGFPCTAVMRNGPRTERSRVVEEPVAGLAQKTDQWRARIKAPLNFNGFCAMPLYLPHYFLAIKSAHSALPYATRLKTHASHRKSPPLRANSPLCIATQAASLRH